VDRARGRGFRAGAWRFHFSDLLGRAPFLGTPTPQPRSATCPTDALRQARHTRMPQETPTFETSLTPRASMPRVRCEDRQTRARRWCPCAPPAEHTSGIPQRQACARAFRRPDRLAFRSAAAAVPGQTRVLLRSPTGARAKMLKLSPDAPAIADDRRAARPVRPPLHEAGGSGPPGIHLELSDPGAHLTSALEIGRARDTADALWIRSSARRLEASESVARPQGRSCPVARADAP
jgi:hypothetical protein